MQRYLKKWTWLSKIHNLYDLFIHKRLLDWFKSPAKAVTVPEKTRFCKIYYFKKTVRRHSSIAIAIWIMPIKLQIVRVIIQRNGFLTWIINANCKFRIETWKTDCAMSVWLRHECRTHLSTKKLEFSIPTIAKIRGLA